MIQDEYSHTNHDDDDVVHQMVLCLFYTIFVLLFGDLFTYGRHQYTESASSQQVKYKPLQWRKIGVKGHQRNPIMVGSTHFRFGSPRRSKIAAPARSRWRCSLDLRGAVRVPTGCACQNWGRTPAKGGVPFVVPLDQPEQETLKKTPLTVLKGQKWLV